MVDFSKWTLFITLCFAQTARAGHEEIHQCVSAVARNLNQSKAYFGFYELAEKPPRKSSFILGLDPNTAPSKDLRSYFLAPDGLYKVPELNPSQSFYNLKLKSRNQGVAVLGSTINPIACTPSKKCVDVRLTSTSEQSFLQSLSHKISVITDYVLTNEKLRPEMLTDFVTALATCRQVPQLQSIVDSKVTQLHLHLKELENKNGPFPINDEEKPKEVSI